MVRTKWGTELPCMYEKTIAELPNGYSQAMVSVTPLKQLAQQLNAQQGQEHPTAHTEHQ